MAVPTLFGTWSPLYIGASGLMLAVGALLRRERQHAFWLGVVVVCLLLAGHNTVLTTCFTFVPGVNTFASRNALPRWQSSPSRCWRPISLIGS
ncbi:MAG: hypothetical protein U0694_21740 [Anaerolineae bacterium]